MYRVAIVEDERACALDVEQQLQRFAEENGVAFAIRKYRSALELVESYRPQYDILFLDIEMPVLDGMTAAQQIREVDERVQIMFITHAARYAVRSYEVQAADYMLKPLSYPAFALKMKRLLGTLKQRCGKQLLLQGQGFVRRIAAEDVYYVEVVHNNLIYHTVLGNFTCRGTLRNLEAELQEAHFARCNSCYLVNLAWFEEMRGDIAMVHGDALKVSRNRRKEFLNAVLMFYEGG